MKRKEKAKTAADMMNMYIHCMPSEKNVNDLPNVLWRLRFFAPVSCVLCHLLSASSQKHASIHLAHCECVREKRYIPNKTCQSNWWQQTFGQLQFFPSRCFINVRIHYYHRSIEFFPISIPLSKKTINASKKRERYVVNV